MFRQVCHLPTSSFTVACLTLQKAYWSLSLTAMAMLAGMVHGVVVHTTNETPLLLASDRSASGTVSESREEGMDTAIRG